MQKFRNYAVVGIFLLVVFGLLIAHILLPDAEVSKAERRKLEQAPELSLETIMDGSYMTDLETYLLDQFPARDFFRSIKAVTRFDLFQQLDNNGVYMVDGSVSKLEYPLDEGAVNYAVDKLNWVQETYLSGMDVYYAVIPDKNVFLAEPNGYPSLDYDRLLSLVQEGLAGMTYIDIFDALDISDYYDTDSHWKQECLQPVVDRLLTGMGMGQYAPDLEKWQAHTLSPFYGVYYGQSALNLAPDTITYLTSPATDAATVTGVEFEGSLPVYTTDRFEGMDSYDVFLAGAQALIEIECPNAKTDKELIIFRDSFGSSIAPLFTETYAKITLVDLRYFTSSMLGDYLTFEDQDVLFLYSASLLHNGRLLK